MAANLTEADERRFAAMWADGVTVVEILARFKIGQETMDKMRKRLGLESRRGSFWSLEREEAARRLYIDEGKSASEVARILGHGATRNTIIGKAHRMGWMTGARQPAAKPRKLATLPKMPKVPKNKPALVFGSLPRPVNDNAKPKAAPPVTLASVESPNARPWMENRRPDECNWTLGERHEIKFCCNPVHARGWCAGHYAIGTVPTTPIRPRAAASYSHHDVVKRDWPKRRETERTVWDDARQNTA